MSVRGVMNDGGGGWRDLGLVGLLFTFCFLLVSSTLESTCLTSSWVRNASAGSADPDGIKTTEILTQTICLYSISAELKQYLIDAFNPKHAFMCFVFPGMRTHGNNEDFF